MAKVAKPANTLKLDPEPTPAAESKDFQNPDDRRLDIRNNHQLALLSRTQGPIGGLIGCSDSSLTVAFILLILGFLAIGIAGIGLMYSENFGGIIDKLITFELTVAGYVFGRKTAGDTAPSE